MNLRAYFDKIRDVEQSLSSEEVVVVSVGTPDGGCPGRVMVLNRSLAARMLVDGRVRLATKEESVSYRNAAATEHAEAVEKLSEPRIVFMSALERVRGGTANSVRK